MNLTDLEMWSAFVGAVLPPIVAVINQAHWPRMLRAIVSVVLALIAAAVTCWLKGDLSNGSYAHSVLVVLTAMLATYHWFWRPSTIAPTIEVNTTTR